MGNVTWGEAESCREWFTGGETESVGQKANDILARVQNAKEVAVEEEQHSLWCKIMKHRSESIRNVSAGKLLKHASWRHGRGIMVPSFC